MTKGWAWFVTGHGLQILETTLPAWLPRQRWFGAKTKKIQSVKVLDWAELPAPVAAKATVQPGTDLPSVSSIPPALFYFEIGYGDNLADTYQVPLAFSVGADADALTAQHPESILAMMPSPAGSGVLHDATVREDLRQGVLALIERNATVALSTTRVAALEVAASRAAAASGNTGSEAMTNGEAVEVLQHPEWATTNRASAGEVHLRPHEVFPAERPGCRRRPTAAAAEQCRPPSSRRAPVAGPISAQPGEAVTRPGPVRAPPPAQQPGNRPRPAILPRVRSARRPCLLCVCPVARCSPSAGPHWISRPVQHVNHLW
jgi:maltose alpha-D-glucosyltransferase/alpha-amylase